MRNLYGQPLHACGESHHTPGSWDAERKCSELGGGVHQICAVMHPDTAEDFSTETGQSDWSKGREGQNHCLCLGAYALYTAKGKDQGKDCSGNLNNPEESSNSILDETHYYAFLS